MLLLPFKAKEKEQKNSILLKMFHSDESLKKMRCDSSEYTSAQRPASPGIVISETDGSESSVKLMNYHVLHEEQYHSLSPTLPKYYFIQKSMKHRQVIKKTMHLFLPRSLHQIPKVILISQTTRICHVMIQTNRNDVSPVTGYKSVRVHISYIPNHIHAENPIVWYSNKDNNFTRNPPPYLRQP